MSESRKRTRSQQGGLQADDSRQFYVGGGGGGGGRPRRRQKKHRRGGGGRGRDQEGEASLGVMRRENERKTELHYGSKPGSTSVPRTVPPAPENTTSYLMRHNPLAPDDMPFEMIDRIKENKKHSQWTSGYESIGEDIAECPGFQFYGSNLGLIQKLAKPSDVDEETSMHGVLSGDGAETIDSIRGFKLVPYDSDGEADRDHATSERRLKNVLDEQTAYTMQLEDENMDLREKVYLLQAELEEARATLRRAGVAHGSDSDGGGDATEDSGTKFR
mmetsp:Transcript_17058/g.54383  ORF Transcript_17058/g.54383 Transcript_17058/m.54383 type:complete len:274 (+) Transcript_17058:1557-2378(+)